MLSPRFVLSPRLVLSHKTYTSTRTLSHAASFTQAAKLCVQLGQHILKHMQWRQLLPTPAAAFLCWVVLPAEVAGCVVA